MNAMRLAVFSLMLCSIFVSCTETEVTNVDAGVSRELAKERKKNLAKISYDLSFVIPEEKSAPIIGSQVISFTTKNAETPVILDFNVPATHLKSVIINSTAMTTAQIVNEHIALDPGMIKKGFNKVEIEFTAGDLSLNRNDDYLYTLFVPDRASTAFPCFDQPDLKARYKLKLDIPSAWKAISNAAVENEETSGDRRSLTFGWSDLMSTYLFSFVAGKFEVDTASFDGFQMRMLHRETDTAKVNANMDDVFELHYEALRWLEDYTGVKYPFQKFDFALIPGFQYGGMEHVGAIQYRASRLFLDESATLDDKIGRSMLIAHETAHMWFGNLVTMEWFDDVWLKEVFANFMASKITEPKFPEVDHDLNFLFAHFPQAYAVDRTSGANAIKQNLENLKNAGSMYGATIYHKAPIVMKQLEKTMGENAFKLAIRQYLQDFEHKNANWSDLVEIFDLRTEENIAQWSKVWIEEPGMPFIDLEFVNTERVRKYDIVQYDLTGGNSTWAQNYTVLFSYDDSDIAFPIYHGDVHYVITKNLDTYAPQFIQLNADGLGYGVFSYGLDYVRDEFLFNKARVDIPRIDGELRRGAAYISLHEFLLYEGLNPQLYLSFLEDYVREERQDLMVGYLLDNLELIYWKFMPKEHRLENAQSIEGTLLNKFNWTDDQELKALLLKKYIRLVQTDGGLQRLKDLWSGEWTPKGVELSENDRINLAFEIAIRDGAEGSKVLDALLAELSNQDKIARVKFIMPALSADESVRDEFFNGLMSAENRAHESWVLSALRYLHHPLRTGTSIKHLKASLDVLEELQRTGDIFFPKRWLDNTLWAYNSSEAVAIVSQYLQDNPGLDDKLKQKVLQSSDMLFRAERDISAYLQKQ